MEKEQKNSLSDIIIIDVAKNTNEPETTEKSIRHNEGRCDVQYEEAAQQMDNNNREKESIVEKRRKRVLSDKEMIVWVYIDHCTAANHSRQIKTEE